MSLDAVGLALATATICSNLALGLHNFVHSVKEAPERARRTHNSLVALQKCLQEIANLLYFQSPMDPREKLVYDSTFETLKEIELGLKELSQKLQLDEILKEDNSCIKIVAIVFKRLRDEDDIKEIQERIEHYERDLQKRFDMLLLLSSRNTQAGVQNLAYVVRKFLIRLLKNGKNIETQRRLTAAGHHFNDISDANSMADSDLTLRDLETLENLQDYSMVQRCSGALNSQHRPLSAMEDVPGAENNNPGMDGSHHSVYSTNPNSKDLISTNVPSFNTSTIQNMPDPNHRQSRPEAQEGEFELKERLKDCEKKITEMLKCKNFAKAAEFQQERIDVRRSLEVFTFNEECEMKEELAHIYVQLETEGLERARDILCGLLLTENGLEENGSPERRGRLYHSLSKIDFRTSDFHKAFESAHTAAYTRLAEPELSPKDRKLVAEAALICYESATQFGDQRKGYSTFQNIAEKLGDPNFTIPKGPDDDARILKWCRKQGFQVDSEDFKYHVCDMNARGDLKGFSPIHAAIMKDEIVKLEHMLSSECDFEVRSKTFHDDPTPLLLACSERNVEALKILLRKGALVDAKDAFGMNGLHRCQNSLRGGTKIARLLLEHDKTGQLNIEEKDQYGHTAVYLAAQVGDVEMLKFLLGPQQRANVDVQALDGSTPLMAAVSSNITNTQSVVRELLKHDPDTKLRNEDGRTVEDIAKNEAQKDILKMLKLCRKQSNLPDEQSQRCSGSRSSLSSASMQVHTPCRYTNCPGNLNRSANGDSDSTRRHSSVSVASGFRKSALRKLSLR